MLSPGSEKPKITSMACSSNKFSVVIDFSYDELMSSKVRFKNLVYNCVTIHISNLFPSYRTSSNVVIK